MADKVLDTGALIELQRDGSLLRDVLEVATTQRARLITPAPTLVEFLGASPPALRAAADWIASHLQVSDVDEALARRGAAILRAAVDADPTCSPSAMDALVAAEAERRAADVVIRGDRADFEALASAIGRLRVIDLPEV